MRHWFVTAENNLPIRITTTSYRGQLVVIIRATNMCNALYKNDLILASFSLVSDRFSEMQQEMEEEENANLDLDVVYRTPENLVIYTQPGRASERAAFTDQPSIYAVDGLVRSDSVWGGGGGGGG